MLRKIQECGILPSAIKPNSTCKVVSIILLWVTKPLKIILLVTIIPPWEIGLFAIMLKGKIMQPMVHGL